MSGVEGGCLSPSALKRSQRFSIGFRSGLDDGLFNVATPYWRKKTLDYTSSVRPSIVVLKDCLALYLLEYRECQWLKDLIRVLLSAKSAMYKVPGGPMASGDPSPNHERSSTVCRNLLDTVWVVSPSWSSQDSKRPSSLWWRLNLDLCVNKIWFHWGFVHRRCCVHHQGRILCGHEKNNNMKHVNQSRVLMLTLSMNKHS